MKTAEDIVKDKKTEIVSVSYDQTVQQVCQLMVDSKIGAILVKNKSSYVGIWTERDLLRNFTAPDFDPHTARIGDYMTTRVHSVSHDTPIHKIEEMFLGLFVRHLPVDKDGETIGMISIGDVLRASLLEKEQQFKELNEFVNWDYYENWRSGAVKKNHRLVFGVSSCLLRISNKPVFDYHY
jgi:signal-transduction protein with cAMP-binding, CBS, and nucleotidyltransferase domain